MDLAQFLGVSMTYNVVVGAIGVALVIAFIIVKKKQAAKDDD